MQPFSALHVFTIANFRLIISCFLVQNQAKLNHQMQAARQMIEPS